MTAYAQLGLIAQPDVVVVTDEQIEALATRLWNQGNHLMAEKVNALASGDKHGGSVRLTRATAERWGLV